MLKYFLNNYLRKRSCIWQISWCWIYFDLCVQTGKYREDLYQLETGGKNYFLSDGKRLTYLKTKFFFFFTCTNFSVKSKDANTVCYKDCLIFDALNCHSGLSSSQWYHFISLTQPIKYWWCFYQMYRRSQTHFQY